MKFITLLFTLLLHFALFAQFGNGSDGIPVIGANTVLNSYKKIQSASGSTFTLLNTSAFSLVSGNVVLVINMLTGDYELRDVISVSGTDVVLSAGIVSNTLFANYSQMIKVPQFSNVTISTGNSITCPAWDGETGGVICFLVSNILSLDAGEIDASNKGFFGGNGGIGGPGGLGGLGGFSGSNMSSNGLYGMGGSGINGAGNGGAYGDVGINGASGSLAYFNSTTSILPCGNAIPSCNNTHNSNSSNNLFFGDGGAGGNGGYGKAGAGGGGSKCSITGENGEVGGNGGNGGNGGIGGGIILIKAGSITHNNTLIKAICSSGAPGASGTNGGAGGDGICGGGGGDGADGGNGGGGGNGGAGGAIKIYKGGDAVNTSFVNVAGGLAMLGGQGGQGGLGGLNSNASCCNPLCDLSELIPFLTHPNTVVSTVAGITHFIFTLGDSILDLSYQDSINCLGNPIGVLSGTLYENNILLNNYLFKISSNTTNILANLIDFVVNDPPNLDSTNQTILTTNYLLSRNCIECGTGYELPENGDSGTDGPSSTPGGIGFFDEECVAPVIAPNNGIIWTCANSFAFLSVSASGGTGSYSYQWYEGGVGTGGTLIPGANSPTFSPNNFSPGTYFYYCIITNLVSGGCSTQSELIQVIVEQPPYISFGTNQSICAGEIVSLSAVYWGGGSFFYPMWTSNGDGAFTNVFSLNTVYIPGAQDIAAGGVILEIYYSSFPGGCFYNDFIWVTIHPNHVVNSTINICQGETYSFGGNNLTTAGTYTETFQTISGCDSTVNLTLVVNPTFSSSTNLDICQGTTTQFYGQTLSTSGTYSHALQAVNGCDSIVSINLTVNPVFSSSSSLTICQGTTTQFYGQTLSTSGTYSHTLQAVTGCDSIVTLNLTVLSSSITLSSSIVQGNISCQGDTSGFIQLTVSGGTPSYTYLWSNGATTEDLINLPAGSYSVLITDANGCSITNQSFITEPISALSINGNQTNIGCFGGNNGSISINAQGGTPSYDYLWNNGQTTSSINGLSTGTYTVLVTDILNCSTTMTFTIVQPLGEMGLTSTVINPSCLNTSTGSIDISVLNGTPTYNYSWSNGETTEDINNLSSGNYIVTVTDALGCVINTTLTVEDPVNPLIVTPTVNNLNCYGGSDAFINLAISGGISPYDILWNNGETLSMIDSLSAGNYSVMVSDNQGCQIPLSFTISQPAPIVANFNPSATSGCSPLTVTFNNSSSGSYTNYLWNFGNGSTSITENATITFTQPSCYYISLIVSNAAGCADTLSVDSLVCVFAGPDASFVTSSGGIDFYTGQLALQNTSNGAISDYHWSFGDGSPNSSLENPIHYYPEEQVGTYLVILSVIDTNGCVDTTSYVFSLVENLSVYVPNTITINDDNINEVFLPVFSNVDILQSYKLEIFDRWGEMIWETDNVSKGWNGRYKENKNVQIGTYTWKILYKDNVSVSRVMVGHVNVIR
jgi:gliding motility-associated-like protein